MAGIPIQNILDKAISEDEYRRLFHEEKKSGFFDLPKNKTCRHPEHEPPSHICIPQGKGFRHVCPGCGRIVDIIPPQITF